MDINQDTKPTQGNRMKKWHLPFLLFLIIATILIVRHQKEGTTCFQQDEDMVFGTIFHATYQCDSSLHEQIMNELHQVDASLSMFNPASTVSRINRGESDQTDSLLHYLFRMSQQISKATDGAFDVTVAPLVNAWGFGFKNGVLPDSAQVDSLKTIIGWNRIRMEDDGRIIKEDERMIMDFSAVAKGFGSDCVAALFQRLGIQNYMIEIGGEIVVKGKNPKGEDWRIGINKPVEDSTATNQEMQTIISMTDCAIATSGNYRNFHMDKDGRKRAHTIDPHTGYPVQHNILSSTIVAPTCAMADAFATSFMVMGLEKAKAVLTKHPELKAYFIYTDEKGNNKIWHSSNFNIEDK